jgi:hypothetical protein
MNNNFERTHLKKEDAVSRFIVFGIMAVMVGVILLTGKQPTIFRNEQGRVIGVHDFTVPFRIAGVTTLLIACGLFRAGWRRWMMKAFEQRQEPISVFSRGGDWLAKPRLLWIGCNLALVGLSFWTGYDEMPWLPVLPSASLYVTLAIGSCLFAIGVVAVSRVTVLKAPSWNRFPLNWTSDPLQALFISSLCLLAALVGTMVQLNFVASGNIWMALAFVSVLSGLLVGQGVVYLMNRARRKKEKRASKHAE